jgi:zinc protease
MKSRWARTLSTAAALLALTAPLAGAAPASSPPPSESASGVLEATLRNGLRVVIVRNTIAPAVSTELTYLVGSRDDPAGVPGMAHAQEHMMFRGTKHLSTSELGTVATALGGSFNASTTDTLTQYQFTVPAADLDAVLRIESDRMRDVLDAQSQWQNERGAIEQEVLRDESAPGNDFFRVVQLLAYAGTPYGHEGVGTKAAFDKLTGPQIKAFHDRWYAPNNAVLVVAGDVDPARALAQIRTRFEAIPSRPVPRHAAARLRPLARTVLHRPTRLVYPLAVVGFRLPGVESPDFLPSFVLQGVLDSPRGNVHALADSGEALDAQWISLPYVPEAQLGLASAALGANADPHRAALKLEAILSGYARHGVPRELFESTRRQLIAGQEQSRNSISALASDWATTIALDREPSIAREQELIARVTLADVNRVAKKYLDPAHAIVGELTPTAGASQSAAPAPAQASPEKPLAAQPPVTHLPGWAEQLVAHVAPPAAGPAPAREKLANGMTLIVKPESISDSVFVFGRVKNSPALEEPAGKTGVAAVLSALFAYGTRGQDRLAFQRAQDDAESQVSAGTDFGLQTTSRAFGRGIALLARNELQPRFDQPTFELARRRAIDSLQTALNSTGTVVARRTAALMLPPGDPELREPTVAELQALTLDDVKAYYAKTLRPDLTTVVVVGNVTPQAAKAAVEREFGAWHAVGEPPATELPPLPPNRAGEVKLPLPIGQDTVTFQQIVPLGRSAPDLYPLLLGNAILGGGSIGPEQSRLFRDLRQNAGLVYTVASQLQPRRSRYEFSIRFACLPQNEPRIASLIDAEIGRLSSEPVGDFELALAKASIVRQTVISGASVGALGGALLDNASQGYPLDQAVLDARQLVATDARAVQRSFAAYVKPENFVRVIEGP